MTTRRKLIAVGCIVAVIGVGWLAWPYLSFAYAVSASLHEQGIQNQAAKPLFEAVVTNKLKIGDSLEHAKELLSYAGLDFTVARKPFPRPMVQSIYRAGRWSGFTIQLELDKQDRISKIDIHEYFTGP